MANGNIILSYPNRADGATITGGSWLTALPAANLANRELWKVARSTNTALASTQCSVDLGATRLLRCVALVNHNLSATAQWIVKLFDDGNVDNQVLYSEQFDNAYWSTTRSSVIADTVIAPDGTASADKLVEDTSATTDHYVYAIVNGIDTSATYTTLVHFKPGGRNGLRVQMYAVDAPGNRATALFNVATGLIMPIAEGDGEVTGTSIEVLDNGWYGLVVTGTPSLSGAGTGVVINFTLVADESTLVYTGDGSSGAYLWGAQLCQESSVSIYKPTTSLPSSRELKWSSGWRDAWAMTFGNLLEWESVAWWAGGGDDDYYRSPFPALAVCDDFYQGRYVQVEINDTSNPDGYIQAGRLFAGGGLQPATNPSYGLQDSWRDLSIVEISESGAAWSIEKRRLRQTSFVIDHLTHAESAYVHDMQRQLGTVNEVLYVPYPDDIGSSQRYGFLGRLSELSPIEYPYPLSRSTAFKMEERG